MTHHYDSPPSQVRNTARQARKAELVSELKGNLQALRGQYVETENETTAATAAAAGMPEKDNSGGHSRSGDGDGSIDAAGNVIAGFGFQRTAAPTPDDSSSNNNNLDCASCHECSALRARIQDLEASDAAQSSKQQRQHHHQQQEQQQQRRQQQQEGHLDQHRERVQRLSCENSALIESNGMLQIQLHGLTAQLQTERNESVVAVERLNGEIVRTFVVMLT